VRGEKGAKCSLFSRWINSHVGAPVDTLGLGPALSAVRALCTFKMSGLVIMLVCETRRVHGAGRGLGRGRVGLVARAHRSDADREGRSCAAGLQPKPAPSRPPKAAAARCTGNSQTARPLIAAQAARATHATSATSASFAFWRQSAPGNRRHWRRAEHESRRTRNHERSSRLTRRTSRPPARLARGQGRRNFHARSAPG